MHLHPAFFFLFLVSALWLWKACEMLMKKKKLRFLQRTNSFVPTSFVPFPTICERLWPRFPEMPTHCCTAMMYWMIKHGNRFFRTFTTMPNGWSGLLKICFLSRKLRMEMLSCIFLIRLLMTSYQKHSGISTEDRQNIILRWIAEKYPCWMRVDAGLIMQVLINLVNNRDQIYSGRINYPNHSNPARKCSWNLCQW